MLILRCDRRGPRSLAWQLRVAARIERWQDSRAAALQSRGHEVSGQGTAIHHGHPHLLHNRMLHAWTCGPPAPTPHSGPPAPPPQRRRRTLLPVRVQPGVSSGVPRSPHCHLWRPGRRAAALLAPVLRPPEPVCSAAGPATVRGAAGARCQSPIVLFHAGRERGTGWVLWGCRRPGPRCHGRRRPCGPITAPAPCNTPLLPLPQPNPRTRCLACSSSVRSGSACASSATSTHMTKTR